MTYGWDIDELRRDIQSVKNEMYRFAMNDDLRHASSLLARIEQRVGIMSSSLDSLTETVQVMNERLMALEEASQGE
jgi:hypothetical protein